MAEERTIQIQDDAGNIYHPQTKASAVFLDNGKSVDACLGDLSTLKTTDKTSTVNAVNELFQNVDNGKNSVYSAIVGKGTTPASKDFADLVSGINLINTGKKFAQGDIQNVDMTGIQNKTLTVTGLTFCPRIILARASIGTGYIGGYWNLPSRIRTFGDVDTEYVEPNNATDGGFTILIHSNTSRLDVLSSVHWEAVE